MGMNNRSYILGIRLTNDEKVYLRKAYKSYKKTNKDSLTMSDYVRHVLKNACAEELQVLVKAPIEEVVNA